MRKHGKRSRNAACTYFGLGALVSASTFAQQASEAPAAKGDPGALLLEEVIVTADRRNSFGADLVEAGTFRGARALDTPLTIDVVTRNLIESQQAISMLDALKNTSGVTTAQLNAAVYSNLAVRGISIDNRNNYKLDGSLPVLNYIDLPLEDKERVEVLKGVSALYYGFAAPSGIVNLVAKRPPPEPLLTATAFGNSHGAAGGHIDAGDRFFDDKVGVRSNLVYSSNKIGVDHTGGFRDLGSLAVDFRPTQKLTFQLDGEYIRKRATEPTTYLVAIPKTGAPVLPPIPDPTKNLGAQWLYGDGREVNGLAKAIYRAFRNWEVTLQAGRSYVNRDRLYSQFQNYNLTTGDGTVQVTFTNGNWYINNNYRVELAGAFFTGPIKHELSIGGSRNQRVGEVTSNPTQSYNQNLYNPVELPFTPMKARALLNHSDINDGGVWTFDRMSYSSWLQVLGGVRYTDYSDLNSNTHITQRAYETSPSAGVVIKPVDSVSLYSTYIEGLEEGGTAPGGTKNVGAVLDPSVTKQYEFGAKTAINHLLLTTAYFHLDRPSYFTNTSQVFVHDGRTVYKGYEFSATGEIIESLSVYGTATYLDAAQAQTAGGLLNGLRPENTARFTGSLFFEYRLPVPGGLSVSAGLFRVGDRAINNNNSAIIGGYTTYDLGARYTTNIGPSSTTVRLYVDNVTNVKYWAATGASLLNPNLPRTVKFSVTAQL